MYVAIAIGVVVLLGAAFLFRRRDTGYKVDEFAKARSLTTEWARRTATQPAPERPADVDRKSSTSRPEDDSQ